MLEGFLGSLLGKILAVVTGLAGVVGGMAAAGALPGIGEDNSASVDTSTSTPAGDASASASVSPGGIPGLPDVPGLPDLSVLNGVELPEVVDASDVLAAALEAQQIASAARAAASECSNSVIAQIMELAGSASGVTDPAAAQQLADSAIAIGNNARECAANAQALAQSGVDQALLASALLDSLDLPVANPADGAADSGIASARTAVLDASDIAGDALDLAFGIADHVSQIIGESVGGATGIQQKAQAAALRAAGPATGVTGGLPVPGLGDGGLPVPGLGDGGLPVPGLGGIDPTDPDGLAVGLINTALATFWGAVDGNSPLPVPGTLPGVGGLLP